MKDLSSPGDDEKLGDEREVKGPEIELGESVIVDYLNGGSFADATVAAVDQSGREVRLDPQEIVDARVAGLYYTEFSSKSLPSEHQERVVAKALSAIAAFIRKGVAKLILNASKTDSIVVEL